MIPNEDLLVLQGVHREFPMGDGQIVALRDIDLCIRAGEMVAIVGSSGCGKSTLINIIGCLDRHSSGVYRVAGTNVENLNSNSLAALRREYFGFVFQRFQLLNHLSALENVGVPAIYTGLDRSSRSIRASALLGRLGLSDRLAHRPSQLSGGQQQRVSIARALMNGAQVILADEPTAALDKQSGEEMLGVLMELHAAGHTILIATHDARVTEYAQRIVRLRDGRIVDDLSGPGMVRREAYVSQRDDTISGASYLARPNANSKWSRLREVFSLSMISMQAHVLRTCLTMLGIIIGTASVVCVVALGEGSQRQIIKQISAIGTDTIDVYPGKGFGDIHAQSIQTLIPTDAEGLSAQPYVDSVTPVVSALTSVRFQNVSAMAMLNGVGEGYFRVHGLSVADGKGFDHTAVSQSAPEVVIDDNTRRTLFSNSDPLGQLVLIGNVLCRVVGVAAKGNIAFSNPQALNVFVPYTTAMVRLLGQRQLRGITVRVKDAASIDTAQSAIVSLLTARHGTNDIFINNNATIRNTIKSSGATLRVLVSFIALTSLIVGGIGVMNIMLVTVTERIREIGVRVAVGARQSDILLQFLIEAVLVCVVGAAIGIGLALLVSTTFSYFTVNSPMVFSLLSVGIAFTCSLMVGIVFGFWPARNAARLNPIDALAHE